MTTLHKRLKGRKSHVTFSPTTTTIPPPKMSHYSQQHQYQSPQPYAYGQMPSYQPQSSCTFGVYPPRVRSQLNPTSRDWLRLLQRPLRKWKSVCGPYCPGVRIIDAFLIEGPSMTTYGPG